MKDDAGIYCDAVLCNWINAAVGCVNHEGHEMSHGAPRPDRWFLVPTADGGVKLVPPPFAPTQRIIMSHLPRTAAKGPRDPGAQLGNKEDQVSLTSGNTTRMTPF